MLCSALCALCIVLIILNSILFFYCISALHLPSDQFFLQLGVKLRADNDFYSQVKEVSHAHFARLKAQFHLSNISRNVGQIKNKVKNKNKNKNSNSNSNSNKNILF
jgi:predicted metalloprotease with PDZ domain